MADNTLEASESGGFELADGIYDAVITAITDTESNYGLQKKFTFTLPDVLDEHGVPVAFWDYASTKLSPKSKLGERWIPALVPIDFRGRQRFDLNSLIGQRLRIVVANEDTTKGVRPKVQRWLKLRDESDGEADEDEPDDTCTLCDKAVSAYGPNGKALCSTHAAQARELGLL